jgi:hypothetical protein
VARAKRSIEPESATIEPPLQLSDDECVHKLAKLVENRDDDTLSVVVRLIGRLAVPIE